MSTKLNGHTSLDINNIPQPQEKIGLIEENPIAKLQSYKLSPEGISAIETLANRLTKEAKIKISRAKAIEIAVFYCTKKSLQELLK